MAEFLLEILCEEIPARMQAKAAEDLKRLFDAALTEAQLTFTSSIPHVTPRRLALVVEGLPVQQPDRLEERKGPKVGSPEQAIQGFLKGAGLTSLDEAEQRDTGKGIFWYAVAKQFGRPTEDILTEIVGGLLSSFPWPKSMRWGSHKLLWVRPIRSLLMMLDGVAINERIEFDESLFFVGSKTTVGHRFLSPHRFEVQSFTDYKQRLFENYVILDRTERKTKIARQLADKSGAEGLTVLDDPALLEEVTGLVEWPTVLLGSIDAAFMDLPHEVRTSTMRANQKYFTLRHADGSAAPRFALVANVPGSDGGAAIIAGNERVLRARLADARFFWDQDLKIKLVDRLSGLDRVTFHAKLGMMREKAERLAELSAFIAGQIGGDEKQAREAGLLAKTDLVSGMVGEFPEVQGIMGGYYARAEGKPTTVADAIAEHYKPLGPSDSVPTAPVSVAVALADKLDTLVGFFAIGEPPTGSRDPYALRRAALGVIRLILANNLPLSLEPLIDESARLYSQPVDTNALLAFFADRLKVSLRDQGVRHDYVEAVLGERMDGDLCRIRARVQALGDLLQTETGLALLAGYRRARNIVEIETKKEATIYGSAYDDALLVEPAEKELGASLHVALAEATKLTLAGNFAESMRLLAGLRTIIDNFFETVRVNADDVPLRLNRLKLLSAITAIFDAVADFSKIEG
jgi:glycyl-tRNA synthetase beta chain